MLFSGLNKMLQRATNLLLLSLYALIQVCKENLKPTKLDRTEIELVGARPPAFGDLG
jgi:hypothetical protein